MFSFELFTESLKDEMTKSLGFLLKYFSKKGGELMKQMWQNINGF